MNDFRKAILKVDKPRVHKISNSVRTYDIYKYIRKNKWKGIGHPVTEHDFYLIIRLVNKELANILLSGRDIDLPCRMGRIEVRKYSPIIRFDKGKLDVRLPIDWDRTLNLWEEDEEAHLDRTLVKIEEKEIFTIKYNRATAKYKNKTFYLFFPNRDLKVRLKEQIKNNNFDAFSV